jgi:hypothetical protein
VHRIARTCLVAGLTGALSVSVAWAGIGLVPVPVPTQPVEQVLGGLAPAAPASGDPATSDAAPAALPGLDGGRLYVGASKTDLTPRPQDMQARYPGARWEQSMAACKKLAPEQLAQAIGAPMEELDHLASAGTPWPENPNCLYMGGYGLGPMNPITRFDDELGLWVRAVAIGDGQDLAVFTTIDAVGWLWDYANKCADCGTKQISQALAADPELASRGMRPSRSTCTRATRTPRWTSWAAGATCRTGTWRRPPRRSSRPSRTRCWRWSRRPSSWAG